MAKFKRGDRVRLNSGGPIMTVKYEISEHCETVECVWFVKDEHFTEVFKEECITLVPVEDSIESAIS